MKQRLLGFVLLIMISTQALGQVGSVLGDWITVDDKTGEKRAIVTIYKGHDGLYYGKISEMLMYANMKCDQCTGADHNAPFEGLMIVRGMKYNKQDRQMQGARVLDPESGKFYYGKIYLKDGKLVLRGSIDKRGLLGRNQTWLRKSK